MFLEIVRFFVANLFENWQIDSELKVQRKDNNILLLQIKGARNWHLKRAKNYFGISKGLNWYDFTYSEGVFWSKQA